MSVVNAKATVNASSDSLPIYENPQAWYGPAIKQRVDEWVYQWTQEEIAEIEEALRAVEARGLEILDIGPQDFPLPNIAPKLATIKNTILHGQGFMLLRGLPVEQWTIRQAAIAYWGLGAHMGEPCSQNGKGHVLGHVQNLGLDYNDSLTRGYQTNARLPYHTDSSDIVALLCLQRSKSGGLSSIVSSTTIYNEMAKTRPDLVEILTQPFRRTRWGEVPEGKMPWSEVPIFMPCGGRMIASYVRSAIEKAQRMEGIPKLTAGQIEALDVLDSLTQDPKLYLDMDFQLGDIQLLCNHTVFHSRTVFEDWPEMEKRRHLLRLWLACPDGPKLPPEMMINYQGQTESGRPNGIKTPGVPFVAPLEAE